MYNTVYLGLTKTQLPLHYLHISACSRNSFLYEVSHLSVPVPSCLSISQENSYPDCKSIQIIFLSRDTSIPLPTLLHEENIAFLWK